MRNHLLFLALPAICLAISCSSTKTSSGKSGTSGSTFSYEASSGKCLDKNGKSGLNKIDFETVRKNKDCECADLQDIDLVDLLPGITEANRFTYNNLEGYNFRGADLNKAKIVFNNLRSCDFSGAQMKTFSFGYSEVNGTVDQFTQLPEFGCDEVEDSKISCRK